MIVDSLERAATKAASAYTTALALKLGLIVFPIVTLAGIALCIGVHGYFWARADVQRAATPAEAKQRSDQDNKRPAQDCTAQN